jgi:hypothetical protein
MQQRSMRQKAVFSRWGVEPSSCIKIRVRLSHARAIESWMSNFEFADRTSTQQNHGSTESRPSGGDGDFRAGR